MLNCVLGLVSRPELGQNLRRFPREDHQRIAEVTGVVEEIHQLMDPGTVGDDAQGLVLLLALTLGQHQQLDADGVDFPDAGEIQFDGLVPRQIAHQPGLQRLGMIDGHVLVDRQATRRIAGGGIRTHICHPPWSDSFQNNSIFGLPISLSLLALPRAAWCESRCEDMT